MVRIKYRYLLVHILYPEIADYPSKPTTSAPGNALPDLIQFHRPSPHDLDSQLLSRAIRDQVLLLYGNYGLGLISGSLKVNYFSPATSTAIIRCSRSHFRIVWGALSFMTQLPRRSKKGPMRTCVMRVVRVSGTIKKAEEEAIRRARGAILRARRESGEGKVDGLIGLLSGSDDEALGISGKRKGRNAAGEEEEEVEDDEDMESVDDDD